jgi:hypothetical protein
VRSTSKFVGDEIAYDLRSIQRETHMALFVGLDVSLKMVSICILKADGPDSARC